MSESIADHGGVKNDNSAQAMLDNINAINDASEAAADNTVYLPTGTWWFGDDDIGSGNMLIPGKNNANRGAIGLGFEGDGPGNSILKWGVVTDGAGNLIRYDDTDTNVHDNVVWKDMTYDGNYQNLTFPDNDTTQTAMRCFATLNAEYRNVEFKNFQNGGTRIEAGCNIEADRCSWHDHGIGRANQGSGGGAHPITLTGGDCNVRVTNSAFTLSSGSHTDHGTGTTGVGTYINIYGDGAGSNFLKVNDADEITMERIDYTGQTQEMLDAIDNDTNNITSYGRFFFRRWEGDTAPIPFTIEDIHARKVTRGVFVCFDNTSDADIFSDHPCNFEDVAVDSLTSEKDYTNAWEDDGAVVDFDVRDFAFDGVDGGIFDLTNSTGVIDTVRRQNTGGLGNLSGVTVTNDNPGDPLYTVTVPTESDVGPDTASGQDNTDFSEYA